MKEFFYAFKVALSYFSAIPVRFDVYRTSNFITKSLLFCTPFIGSILALLTLTIFWFLSTELHLLYAALLSSLFYFASYGFLHLEGLADSLDGYYAALSKKNIHALMKEPFIGAIGAIGVVCFVLAKTAALIHFLLYFKESLALVLLFFLSRYSIFIALYFFTPHEQSHFAKELKAELSTKLLSFATITAFIFTLLFFNFWQSLFLLGFVALVTFLSLNILKKRLGFINGDTLGATIELVEFTLLTVVFFL